jgi:predicted acyl esterase
MDLYFPEGYAGKLPVILERTPYDKANRRKADFSAPIMPNSNQAYYFASHGYVVAVQDRRGKFESEGEYTIGYGDINDAYDTLEWFEQQDWFNGKVGMIGCSIPGGNVIRAAMSQHPTLKGLVPQSAAFGHGTAGDTMARGFLRGGVQNMTMPMWTHLLGSKLFYRPSMRLDREEFLKIVDRFNPAPNVGGYENFIDLQTGELKEGFLKILLSLPVVDIDDKLGSPPSDWDDMAAGAPMGTFWTNGDYLDDGEKVEGGALHINSWHDYGVNETILQFQHFQENAVSDWARDNQYLLIGPLSHCNIETVSDNMTNGERYIGDARFDVWGTYKRWWDYSLKSQNNGFDKTPKVQ